MKKLIYVPLLCLSTLVWAQPGTEVYIFNLNINGENISLSNPVNVSNHEGYDNQPSFLEDGCLLYVSSINGQTDVFHFEHGETAQITATPGGEYSPTPTPDGGHFSTILLEPDGRQLLWIYELNGNNPKILIPELKIGYHTWISDDQIVSFVLGDTSTLQLSNIKTGQNTVLAKNIGRSLHKIPGTDLFSYIQIKPGAQNEIRAYNIQSNSSELLVNALEGSQDCAWAPNGLLFMGQGSNLYSWKKGMDNWKLVSDLKQFNLNGITRLAVSPDMKMIAIVISED